VLRDGAYIAEVKERQEESLIEIVRTHQHHTNSVLLHTVKNVKKTFSK
jgi:hypothetical protein